MHESSGSAGQPSPSARARIKGWFLTARNRPRKWVAILVCLYVFYCLLFGFILPRALHGVVTSALSQSLNADCSLERITYNPFSFTLGVHGLRIPYPDGNGMFLTVESIELAPGFSTFLRIAPALGSLKIVRPAFDITLHADGRSSPMQFITEAKQPTGSPAEPSRPFPFIISNLEVTKGSVIFRDEMHGTTHTVEHLSIEVPFASTLQRDNKRPMRPALNATINGKAISVEGRTTPFADTQRSEFRLFVGALPLEYFQPYLTPYTSLILEKGTITTETVLHFARTDEALDIGLSGHLALDGIVLAAPGEGAVFSLEHGSITLKHLLLDLEELSIENILLHNPTISLTKEKNGEFNWQRYLRPAPHVPASPKTATGHTNGTSPVSTNGTVAASANGTVAFQGNSTLPPSANGTLSVPSNTTAVLPVAPPPGTGAQQQSHSTALPAGNATSQQRSNATQHPGSNATLATSNATQAGSANGTRADGSPPHEPQAPVARQGLPIVSLKSFSLQNGHIVWLDAEMGGAAPVDIAPINLEIRDASTEGPGKGAFSLTVGRETVASPALTEEFFRTQAAASLAAAEGAANSTATASNSTLSGNGTLRGNSTLPDASVLSGNGTLRGNGTLSGNGTLPTSTLQKTTASNATLPAKGAVALPASNSSLVQGQPPANAAGAQVAPTAPTTASQGKNITSATAAAITANATTPGNRPAGNGTVPGGNGTVQTINGTLTNGNATVPGTNGTVPGGNAPSNSTLPPRRTPSPLGDMALRGTVGFTPVRVNIHVLINALPLGLSAPYLKQANFTLSGGHVTADTHLFFEERKEGFHFSMEKGDISLRSFAGSTPLPTGSTAAMKVNALSLEKLSYDLATQAMRLGLLTLDAPEIQVTMAAMGDAAPATKKNTKATAAPASAPAATKKKNAAPVPATVASASAATPPAPTATPPKNSASSTPAKKSAAAAPAAPSEFSFALDRFHMTKGTVNIINPAAPKSPLALTGMELVLTDFAAQPGKTVQLSSSATWNGSGKAATTGKGTLTPLNLTLTTVLNNIPLASVSPWLRQVSLLTVASGTFSCDLTTQIADAGIAVKADTTPAQKAKSQAARAKSIKDGNTPAISPAERQPRPEQTSASASNSIGIAVAGKASIDNLSLRDGAQEALSLASMRLFGIRLNTAATTYDIGGLVLQNPRITVTLLPEGMNSFSKAFDVTGEKARQARLAQQSKQAQKAKTGGLEQALQEAQSSGVTPPPPAQPAASPAPKNIRIEPLLPDIARFTLGALTIQNGQVRIQDQTLLRKSTVTLSALNFKMTGLSSAAGAKAAINLSANLEGAPLTVTGTASPLFTPLQAMVDVKLAGMDMIPLSPYAEKFIAYPIESGALSLTTSMQTDGTELKASNEILLGKLTLGEKMNFKGAPNLPVKLGLSLLADGNGLVTLSLPIAGRLDDPNFRIGGIVAKVLGNVLIKVATSPFSLLGAVVDGVTGGSGPDLQYVPFAPGDDRVSAAALKTIHDVVALLQKRPKVTLVLQGVVDEGENAVLAEAFIRQGVQQMKWESLSSKEQQATRPTELEVDPAANAEEYASLLFDFYAEQPFPKPKTLGITKKQPVEEMIRMITAAVPTTDAALEALAQKRAEAVQKEIIAIAPALADRVSIAATPKVRAAAQGQALMSRVELGVK